MDMNDEGRIMPDFVSGTHAFHHTVDSALATLDSLRLPPSRISICSGGFGYPANWVVRQEPEPGTPVTGATEIALYVSTGGFLHELPVGMWDRGGEEQPGTAELLDPIDDPFQKAAHWLREGAKLFDIQPDHLEDCSRWIGLFGFEAENWPPARWHALALLLPSLQAAAGTETGIRLAPRLLLALPVDEIRRADHCAHLDPDEYTLLGTKLSRLGLDTVVGDRFETLARITLVIGPVPLDTYFQYCEAQQAKLLQTVLSLVVPLHQRYSVQWLVEDRRFGPQLGDEYRNARLGINSSLGRERWPSPGTSRSEITV
jgi:hypothetical protein